MVAVDALVEVLADDAHQELLPHAVEVVKVRVRGQVDHPLAARLVRLVLPHGLDALLEEVVVGAELQGGRLLDDVRHGPELLDGRDHLHHLEVVLPRDGVGLDGALGVVPEGPRVLERVRAGGVDVGHLSRCAKGGFGEF